MAGKNSSEKSSKNKKALEDLGRHKAVAMMAAGFVHQLRTPIHVIQSSAEDLASQNRFLPTFKPQAQLIARSAQRMEAAVNALLRFVKGDKSPLKPGSLHDVLQHLRDFIQDEGRKRSIKLDQKLSHKQTLAMDEYLLQEALLNLLMNALQAMPKGGTLTIRSEDTGKKIQLEITDTGVGMDAKTLKRIQTPFQTTKKGGLGLGLHFTRQILQQHHASLAFSSRKGTGTTARITFPANT